jgi:hypothetical protein
MIRRKTKRFFFCYVRVEERTWDLASFTWAVITQTISLHSEKAKELYSAENVKFRDEESMARAIVSITPKTVW